MFDNNIPRGLAKALLIHTVTEAREHLLTAAETAGFDVLVTSDKRIKYQQNLEGRKIALVVLTQGRWGLYEKD